MIVDGKQIRPIWLDKDLKTVKVIDQRMLPHEFIVADLTTVDHNIQAIKEMYVRGAPLIGVTAAYGVYLATLNAPDNNISDEYIKKECNRIKAARPTAVNLAWGVDRVLTEIKKTKNNEDKITTARIEAQNIEEEEAENCRKIGEYGLSLIKNISSSKNGKTVNILTHCNAGWLACIEYGTATAPMYTAFDNGIDVHVWVDETRPLNQGSRLTAWELGKHGIKHTVITDNAGGHLMQHGMVDIVIVGTDRTTCTGDVANKIGTYLKALAAQDNNIPFYVALPSSTFDWTFRDGIKEIPIEERDPDEVRYVQGMNQGVTKNVLVPPKNSPAANFAFDVTPARLVTGFITERGICKADEKNILRLFPEKD
ncbi:methylthioribose-1-phosphate isomerase [Desulfosarcina sp. BuS5]|uniref:S-methyl-5-thioribose-1-phosphate isomerase n=1 Tax=Desulfosarcina sp. BuS5 TaxID=933262 RepID=UPI00048657D5|nr:S-methyl-5-thioribose-1-phosphate isomerase [Desulfosarcina sp. BuS5]WDN88501.1 methylthioribose-1-phosphate isomerase [Desulfosarcina sp. BuS5]